MTSNQPEEFARIVSDNRSVAILRALHRLPGYGTNERVMGAWLEELALGDTREAIRAELQRLETLLVIRCERRGEGGEVMVFTLTERGIDHLEGRAVAEGIPRIGPDCPY